MKLEQLLKTTPETLAVEQHADIDLFAGFDSEENEFITMDGYDDCIVGIVERFGQEPIVCYNKDKVITKLESDGMDSEEAEEFFYFNQIGAYFGECTPCFLTMNNTQ
jgi:hypothetical protein